MRRRGFQYAAANSSAMNSVLTTQKTNLKKTTYVLGRSKDATAALTKQKTNMKKTTYMLGRSKDAPAMQGGSVGRSKGAPAMQGGSVGRSKDAPAMQRGSVRETQSGVKTPTSQNNAKIARFQQICVTIPKCQGPRLDMPGSSQTIPKYQGPPATPFESKSYAKELQHDLGDVENLSRHRSSLQRPLASDLPPVE